MSNTEKSAGIFGGPSAAEKEQLLQQFYGKRLLSSAGAGAGLGLGAAALYHLLRGAKPEGKKEKKYPSYGSGTPMIAKAASFAPMPQNPTGFLTQQNHTTDIRDMLGLPKGRTSMGGPAGPTLNPFQGANPLFNPLGKPGWANQQGGGIAPQQQTSPGINGGLTNAPRAPMGMVNGMPNNGTGGFNPLMMKNSFDLNSLSESVGKMLPTTMVPFGAPRVGGGPAPSADPHPWRKSWSTAANIGGAALGTYAGAKLINSLVKAKKKRDQASALDKARAEYYSALGGKSAAILPPGLGASFRAGLGTAASGLRSFGDDMLRAGGQLRDGARSLFSKFQTRFSTPAAAARPPVSAPLGGGVKPPAAGAVKPNLLAESVPNPRVAAPAKPISGRDVYTDPVSGWQYDGSWARPKSRTIVGGFPPAQMAKGAALTEVQSAYYAALAGNTGTLNTAFDVVKQANILSSTASALWNTPQTLRTAYLLTLLGAGGVGAKYMYDRTKNLTEGENLAKAQASRARLKGLPPVWVDPESLAHIKSTAESNE